MDRKTLKYLLKKGNQKLKLLLGFIETNKDFALDTIIKIKKFTQDISLFILGILAHLPISIKKSFFYLCKCGKNLWENIKLTFYQTLGILVALLSILLVIYLVFTLIQNINPTFITSLSSQYILTPENKDIESIKSLQELIAQGKIISASDIYAHMLEYYNTLITILIALMGVFGIVSWISIQGKIKHESELSVDSKFENKDFQCRLEKEVENATKEILSDSTYISKLAEDNVDMIVARLLYSRDFLNKMKEVIQNFKDDKNVMVKHKQLEGVENGDEI